jgi:hypothetical protein
MDIELIRDDIADELGAVYEIISAILDSFPDQGPVHEVIICNDNAMVLLEYARGHTNRAFQCLDRLSN